MIDLHHEVSGAGADVLLLHGMALDLRMWDEQVGPLASRYRVVRVDLYGFGRSPPVQGPYSHTELLAALLDGLGVASAHVVGLSMGGRIAAEFVQTYPRRAQSLVLADADITGLPFRTLGPALGALFARGKSGDIAGAKQAFLAMPFFDAARQRPPVMARLRQMMDDYSGWHFAHIGDGLERRPAEKTSEALARFALPVLALVGELDVVDFHDLADGVVERVPNGRKHVLAGVGHMPNMEDPAAFNRTLLEFLDGVR